MLLARHLRVEAQVIDLDRGLERTMERLECKEGVDLSPLGSVPGRGFGQERGRDEEGECARDERDGREDGTRAVHDSEGDAHSPTDAEEGVRARNEAGMAAQGQFMGGVG